MNILIMPAVAVMLASSPEPRDSGFGKLAEICLQGSLERQPGIAALELHNELESCLATPEAMEAIDIEANYPDCRHAGDSDAVAHCLVSR